MTRSFEVQAGSPHVWLGMAESAHVVTHFLAEVRMTGDAASAARWMHDVVLCHQVVAERRETVERTPSQYADHVLDMLAAFGRFRFLVEDMLVDADRVYVRWRQLGRDKLDDAGGPGTDAPLTEVGSAVYRIEDGRIVEYWVQLDRWGLQAQLGALRGR